MPSAIRTYSGKARVRVCAIRQIGKNAVGDLPLYSCLCRLFKLGVNVNAASVYVGCYGEW